MISECSRLRTQVGRLRRRASRITRCQMFAALIWSAEWRVGAFHAQDLANTAWASAAASQLDVQLIAVWARASVRCLIDIDVQKLANTAWAFATANQSDVLQFAVLARAAEWRLDDFDMKAFANIAWAFATTRQSDVQQFAVLARAAE